MNNSAKLFLKYMELFFANCEQIDLIGFTYIDESGSVTDIDNVLSIKCSNTWLNFHTLDCWTHWSFSNGNADTYSDLEYRYEGRISEKVVGTLVVENAMRIEAVFEIGSSELKGLKFHGELESAFICFIDDMLKVCLGAKKQHADELVLKYATHMTLDELLLVDVISPA